MAVAGGRDGWVVGWAGGSFHSFVFIHAAVYGSVTAVSLCEVRKRTVVMLLRDGQLAPCRCPCLASTKYEVVCNEKKCLYLEQM